MLEWPRRNSYDGRFAEGTKQLQVVGLTGGIASGKSTAAALLGELGAHIIDADVLGHRAYDPGTSAFEAVVETFGNDIVAEDGSVDRRALGQSFLRRRRIKTSHRYCLARNTSIGGVGDPQDR